MQLTLLVGEDGDEDDNHTLVTRLVGVEGVDVVDRSFALVFRFQNFYTGTDRTCGRSCLCDPCILEHSSRRRKRSYNPL